MAVRQHPLSRATTFSLDLTSVTGEQLIFTAPDRGRYTFTNRQPVNFTGNDQSPPPRRNSSA